MPKLIDAYMREKFTNEELYLWMQGRNLETLLRLLQVSLMTLPNVPSKQ